MIQFTDGATGAEMGRPGQVFSITPNTEKLHVLRDPVAEVLDDMAALGQHWIRNRERGRMPYAIRTAMLLVARELIALADQNEQVAQKNITP